MSHLISYNKSHKKIVDAICPGDVCFLKLTKMEHKTDSNMSKTKPNLLPDSLRFEPFNHKVLNSWTMSFLVLRHLVKGENS